MSNIAIRVDNVSKSFKLPHEKQNSLKGLFVNVFNRKRTYEKQQVLKNVSFEIKKGEFYGIVGRNGSGKSTLLKLLAGIYSPDKGHIQVNGKLTPFIELGVGFNPELTGRENIFLNGALLGFNRKEMSAMYDEIVEFAELEKFMDQKLKNYSSGMQVRLAFSIAIRAKSPILLLDEVLAVGDEAFQQKCVTVFDNYKKDKQTVILVTHDMEAVKKYCTRALLLGEGKLIKEGDPREVAALYSKINQESEDTLTPTEQDTETGLSAKILNTEGWPQYRYGYGEDMSVTISWKGEKKVDTVGVAIYSSIGECVFATNSALSNVKITRKQVTYNVKLNIGKGSYFISYGTFSGKNHKIIDFISNGPRFKVFEENNTGEVGMVRLKYNWSQEI